MKIPTTYSLWLDCFDIVKNHSEDEDVLKCMGQGYLELSPGVAERFTIQLTNTIESRLKEMADKFSKNQQRSMGDINLFTKALLDIRKEYNFLVRVCNLPAIPKEYSEKLVDFLQTQANQMQNSLESTSIKSDRTGLLTSTVRKNKVNSLGV